MYFATLIMLSGLLVTVTLLPLSRCEFWWVRDWDFPRLQLACVAFVLLPAVLILLDRAGPTTWVLAGTVLLCLVYQLVWIIPYTRLFPVEVKSSSRRNPENRLRILIANVLAPNRRAEGLLRLIGESQPDVLVTLESDGWWQRRLDSLEPEYPYSVKCPQDNLYGMHVYSKLPLRNPEVRFLVAADIPSIHADVVLRSRQSVAIHFLHPTPPSPTENLQSTERDVELLLVAKQVAQTSSAVVVTGDLNDVAWSSTTRLFRKISGLLDPRVGRGMYNSFHAGYWFIRWPLDHLFHSRHFTLSAIRRLPAFGSDHFPVLVELMCEPEQGKEQAGIPADSEDIAEAEQTLAEKGGR